MPMLRERFEELKHWAFDLQTGPIGEIARELITELERMQNLVDVHRSMYQEDVPVCRNRQKCQRPRGHERLHGRIKKDGTVEFWGPSGSFTIYNLIG